MTILNSRGGLLKNRSIEANLVFFSDFEGADGSTTFTDTKGNTITANGNAQVSTAQKISGNSSVLFDGSGDYLSVASSAVFGFALEPFAIEFWFRLNDVASQRHLFDMRIAGASPRPTIYTFANSLRYFDNADRIIINTIPLATWHHVAVTRDGSGILRLFFNGVSGGTYNASLVNYGASNTFNIGSADSGSNSTDGYIDFMKIYKGIAKYTSDFTPSV
jgi:hypothetical protein